MPSKTAAKRKRASRKAKPKTKGLDALDCKLEISAEPIRDVVTRVEKQGGTIVGSCRDPLGGSPLAIAVLPVDSIEPTPFQRDLSEAHHKKLAGVIEKTGTFLDPIITVPAPNGGFWTPNGRHRLEAMRRLGAKAITTLIAPNTELAWQILALNTEKAHNLKERSLVVARINPLRWIKGEMPDIEGVLKTMRDRAVKFNVEKIRPQDLASMAGAPPDEG